MPPIAAILVGLTAVVALVAMTWHRAGLFGRPPVVPRLRPQHCVRIAFDNETTAIFHHDNPRH